MIFISSKESKAIIGANPYENEISTV